MLAADVRREFPNRSTDEHRRRDLRPPDLGLGQRRCRTSVAGSTAARALERDAGGEVRRGRREDVARVERSRDLRQAVARGRRARAPPRHRARRRRASAGRCRARRTAGRRPSRTATARRSPPTPGSTTARCTPTGRYGIVLREHERALEHRLRRDAVRDVDDRARRARCRAITPWQVPTKSSCSPKSVRNVMTVTVRTSSDPQRRRRGQSRSCVAASAATSSPTDARCGSSRGRS